MKVLFLLLALSFSSYASFTYCSNERVYYSHVSYDMGVRPYPGQKIGTKVLVMDGEILIDEDIIYQTASNSNIQINFFDKGSVIEKTGSFAFGAEVFYQSLSIVKLERNIADELFPKTSLLCKKSWAIVP